MINIVRTYYLCIFFNMATLSLTTISVEIIYIFKCEFELKYAITIIWFLMNSTVEIFLFRTTANFA